MCLLSRFSKLFHKNELKCVNLFLFLNPHKFSLFSNNLDFKAVKLVLTPGMRLVVFLLNKDHESYRTWFFTDFYCVYFLAFRTHMAATPERRMEKNKTNLDFFIGKIEKIYTTQNFHFRIDCITYTLPIFCTVKQNVFSSWTHTCSFSKVTRVWYTYTEKHWL